ncbi:MAG: hypothetical protein ACRDHS_15940, partial [Actinomycetota bacterium]
MLLSLPGVAVVRASNYGAAVGDPGRFPNASAAYRASGLVPARRVGFNAFEAGKMPERQCGPRIERLTAELVGLESRKNELSEEVQADRPQLPAQEEIFELCDRAMIALEGGALPQRKAVMQQVVEKVQVTDRDNILPIFKVPLVSSSLGIFRP